MHGCMVAWMHGCMDAYMDGRMEGWTEGGMDGGMDGRMVHVSLYVGGVFNLLVPFAYLLYTYKCRCFSFMFLRS